MVALILCLLTAFAVVWTQSLLLSGISPYRNDISILPGWEKAMVYFIVFYPMASFAVNLAPDAVLDRLMANKLLYQKTFFIFCGCHVVLSGFAANLCYRLRRTGRSFRVGYIVNMIAGTIYLTAILGAYFEIA